MAKGSSMRPPAYKKIKLHHIRFSGKNTTHTSHKKQQTKLVRIRTLNLGKYPA